MKMKVAIKGKTADGSFAIDEADSDLEETDRKNV